jgi:hypothetical protein
LLKSADEIWHSAVLLRPIEQTEDDVLKITFIDEMPQVFLEPESDQLLQRPLVEGVHGHSQESFKRFLFRAIGSLNCWHSPNLNARSEWLAEGQGGRELLRKF